MNICISPRRTAVYLFSVSIGLTLISLLLNFVRLQTGHETMFGFMSLFDLDMESNIPAFFSVGMLFSASILLFVIALDQKRSGKAYLQWLFLALLFSFLALDEGASIHEKITEWVRQLLHPSGVLAFAWVIPYGIFLILFSIVYMRFWLGLDRELKLLIAISGATYICGAIGWEMAEAYNYSKYGVNWGLGYTLMYTAEEFMEMAGIIIFLYALLRFAQLNSIIVTLCCLTVQEQDIAGSTPTSLS